MSDAAVWFSPAPSELSSSRLSLDFGLRAADLFFRELVVPELGRIWFVRQLSWPVAALMLHESLRAAGASPPKPSSICHGIEALACKLEYFADPEEPSERILGRRAFARDLENEICSFQRLRQPANYVRNTHRQAATRAIRREGGLGFANGRRFDLLELEPVGKALAEAFLEQRVGKGGTSLRKWLTAWIQGEGDLPGWSETLLHALCPEHPTAGEKEFVRSRVLETVTETCVRRQHLARALGRSTELPDVEDVIVPRLQAAGHQQDAKEVIAARAFGAVLDRARDLTAELTRAIEPERGGVPVQNLARDSGIREATGALKTAAQNFSSLVDDSAIREPTSRAFAEEILGAVSDLKIIESMVGRTRDLLAFAEGAVTRGGLFRRIQSSEQDDEREDANDALEPDRRAQQRVDRGPLTTARTFRIANLHSLLLDVARRELA